MSAGPQFVVQRHESRSPHFDLRLERDGVFRSWAVPKGVPEKAGLQRLAIQVEDHSLAFGDFEGTIPAGEYGAGEITIWDRGACPIESCADDGTAGPTVVPKLDRHQLGRWLG